MTKEEKQRIVEKAKKEFPLMREMVIAVKPDVNIPDDGTPLEQLAKNLDMDSKYMLFIDEENIKIIFNRFAEADPVKYKLNDDSWVDLFNLFERTTL